MSKKPIKTDIGGKVKIVHEDPRQLKIVEEIVHQNRIIVESLCAPPLMYSIEKPEIQGMEDEAIK